MGEVVSDRINIFLTVDMQTINNYFNSHDPAPIYKRQVTSWMTILKNPSTLPKDTP